MALRKCPKCELNYIKGDAAYCDVCLREVKRATSRGKRAGEEEQDEVVICSECGEAPAVRGSDLCADCLREQKRQVELENATQLDDEFDESIAADDGDDEPCVDEDE